MPLALAKGVAAVLLLIFLPTLAAVGFILGTISGDLSWSTALAGFTFLMLGGFLVGGALQMAKTWDTPEDSHT